MKATTGEHTGRHLLLEYPAETRSLSMISFFYLSVVLFLGAMIGWGTLLYFRGRAAQKHESELLKLSLAEAGDETRRRGMQDQCALLRTLHADRAISDVRGATAVLSRLWRELSMVHSTIESLRASGAAIRMAERNPSCAREVFETSVPKLPKVDRIIQDLVMLRLLEEGIRSGTIIAGLKEQDKAQEISDASEENLQIILKFRNRLEFLLRSTRESPSSADPVLFPIQMFTMDEGIAELLCRGPLSPQDKAFLIQFTRAKVPDAALVKLLPVMRSGYLPSLSISSLMKSGALDYTPPVWWRHNSESPLQKNPELLAEIRGILKRHGPALINTGILLP